MKTIAIVVVCLLIWNNITWANPDTLSSIKKNTLARWGFTDNPADMLPFEVRYGIEYLSKGDPDMLGARLRLVNRRLVEACSVHKTKPEIEFINATQDGNTLRAEFKVLVSGEIHKISSGPDGISCQELFPEKSSKDTGKKDNVVVAFSEQAMRDSKETLLQSMLEAAQHNPELEYAITPRHFKLGVTFIIRKFIKNNGIAPIRIIRDKKTRPRNVAFIDRLNPSNYIIIRIDDIGKGKARLSALGYEEDVAEVSTGINSTRFTISRLKAGREFYRRLANRNAECLKADLTKKIGKMAGSTYSHITLANNPDIVISITPSDNPEEDRCWLTPGVGYEYLAEIDGENEAVACLVDLKCDEMKKPSTLPSLFEVAASGGQYVAYPASGWTPQDWLRIKQNETYSYFQNIGATQEGEERYVIYRRIDENRQITVIRISPDRRTFTIDGLTIDGKPIILEAGYVHLGALLYVFLSDHKGNEVAHPAKKSGISISPSLRRLACTLDQLVSQGRAKIPNGWREEMVEGEKIWVLGNFQTICWENRWDEDEKRLSALERLSVVRKDILNVPGQAMAKTGAEDGPISCLEERQLHAEGTNEEVLIAQSAKYLGNAPVNEFIDLSAISREGFTEGEYKIQLDKNLESIALRIAYQSTLGLNLRCILENDTTGEAKNTLEGKLNRLNNRLGLNLDEIIKRLNAPHEEKGAINIYIRTSENIQKMRSIEEEDLLVALESYKKASLPGYIPASAIGIGLATLNKACADIRLREKRELSNEKVFQMIDLELREDIFERIKAIYDFYKVKGAKDFTMGGLMYMVIGCADNKRFYATDDYALPPIAKDLIDRINKYHEKLQLILQAA